MLSLPALSPVTLKIRMQAYVDLGHTLGIVAPSCLPTKTEFVPRFEDKAPVAPRVVSRDLIQGP